MTNRPLISIVTPSYNQAQFLEETIQSVLSQDYPHLEYIIIDGGSTDDSVDIIRKYEHEIDYWVSEKDKGQTDAINKGFKRSQGDILAWLNSDDLYMPNALKFVAEYFADHPEVDMIYGGFDRIDAQNNHLERRISGKYNLKDLLSNRLVIPQPATFFRRHCIEAVNGLDAEYFHAMDFNLWVKIGLHFHIKDVEPVLAKFRVHEGAKSKAQAFTVGSELLKTLDWVFGLPDVPFDVLTAKNEIYSGALVTAGIAYYASGYFDQARDSFWQAIRLYPQQIWQSRTILLLLRTYLGNRIITSLRAWKRKRIA